MCNRGSYDKVPQSDTTTKLISNDTTSSLTTSDGITLSLFFYNITVKPLLYPPLPLQLHSSSLPSSCCTSPRCTLTRYPASTLIIHPDNDSNPGCKLMTQDGLFQREFYSKGRDERRGCAHIVEYIIFSLERSESTVII